MASNDQQLTIDQCRDAGLAAALVVLLVSYFGARPNLLLPAIGIMVLAMVAPGLFRPWAIAWWWVAHVLAAVGSTVMLAVIFAVVVTPVGLVRRAMGADPMRMRAWRGQGSVFEERDGTITASDIEAPY